MTRDVDIAWAAGLFEGEGSWSTTHPDKGRGGTRRYLRVCLQTSDLDVLERFRDTVECGSIYAVRPDSRRPHGRPMYQWTVSGEDTFRSLLELFRPYLGERRIARAEELLAEHGSAKEALFA